MLTSGYVNTETILPVQFFYKITNERGTKTVFTYTHVKWFYGQSERAYYLNYFIIKTFEQFRQQKRLSILTLAGCALEYVLLSVAITVLL